LRKLIKRGFSYEDKMGKGAIEFIYSGIMLVIFWLCHDRYTGSSCTRTPNGKGYPWFRSFYPRGTNGEV
jgi:hypothetical protein